MRGILILSLTSLALGAPRPQDYSGDTSALDTDSLGGTIQEIFGKQSSPASHWGRHGHRITVETPQLWTPTVWVEPSRKYLENNPQEDTETRETQGNSTHSRMTRVSMFLSRSSRRVSQATTSRPTTTWWRTRPPSRWTPSSRTATSTQRAWGTSVCPTTSAITGPSSRTAP